MDEEKYEERVTELQEDEKIMRQFEHSKVEAEELLKDKKKMDYTGRCRGRGDRICHQART